MADSFGSLLAGDLAPFQDNFRSDNYLAAAKAVIDILN